MRTSCRFLQFGSVAASTRQSHDLFDGKRVAAIQHIAARLDHIAHDIHDAGAGNQNRVAGKDLHRRDHRLESRRIVFDCDRVLGIVAVRDDHLGRRRRQ